MRDHAVSQGIADNGFIIATLATENFADLGPDVDFLGTDLRANRTGRTTDHPTQARFYLQLGDINIAQIGGQTGQRVDGGGKHPVQIGLPLGQPHFLQGGHGQLGLRIEEIVETPLLHLGAVANIINRDGAVALLPNQGEGGVFQSFVGV